MKIITKIKWWKMFKEYINYFNVGYNKFKGKQSLNNEFLWQEVIKVTEYALINIHNFCTIEYGN